MCVTSGTRFAEARIWWYIPCRQSGSAPTNIRVLQLQAVGSDSDLRTRWEGHRLRLWWYVNKEQDCYARYERRYGWCRGGVIIILHSCQIGFLPESALPFVHCRK
uniref:Uncharacterized protein n=1 Tax=Parascaris equorum TaxID=6256 RepID=A0A914RX28_PAREQ